MINNNQLHFSKQIFTIPILFVFLIWLVYFIEINFDFNFNKYGVFPRDFKGLRGILFSPFIHSNTKHLFNNSIPLFLLLSSLFMFYKEVALKVVLYGGFYTGMITWIIARESFHIGASGIVYVLFSFIFFSGVLRKHYRLVSVSLIVIFLYGSMIWYVLPIKEGLSWEGHLSGFLVGLLLSFFYKNIGIKKTEPYFEETAFDLLFDESGNFIPQSQVRDIPDEIIHSVTDTD